IGFAMSEAAFRSKLEAAGVESSLVQKAVTWRDTPSGWYKIIDAPLEIVLRDGLVRAERTEAEGYPLSLREVGFLGFQAGRRQTSARKSNTFLRSFTRTRHNVSC